MRAKLSLVSAAIIGLVAAAPSGASPLPGWTLKAQTAHFSFYSRGNLPVDAARSERYLTELERTLGHAMTGRVSYYRHASPQEIAAVTGVYASGVTFARNHEIHSTHAFHAHEIVHALASEMGDPGVFFQEGLAMTIGDRPRLARAAGRALTRVRRIDRLSDLVDQFDGLDPQVAYPLAGSFMVHLIRSHGMERVVAFFQLCASPGVREDAFRRTFGESLDQAGRDWLAGLKTAPTGGYR